MKSSKEHKAVFKLREIRNEHYGHLSKAEVSDDTLKQLIENVKNTTLTSKTIKLMRIVAYFILNLIYFLSSGSMNKLTSL